jgi:hypothetical protein
MTILWEFDEKHPKQVSAYGTVSWVTFSRPCGTQFGEVVLTQALSPDIYQVSSLAFSPEVWVSFYEKDVQPERSDLQTPCTTLSSRGIYATCGRSGRSCA